MILPNDLPPIKYSNKLALSLNIASMSIHKKKYMDLLVSKSFLKNYFSLIRS